MVQVFVPVRLYVPTGRPAAVIQRLKMQKVPVGNPGRLAV
jgi:hypothetical protein